ncbi:SGNH/GDSL hydrolase family protein [Streptomyces nitrosporeus]|uniref:SGNH/GDSL hydrolase family protein n=1 Tax=Streptomyces nitrosporeus TaxID=28894 RepID=A0A5J6F9N0_9ACTN|nr:SGNH/GDSL hydrolase family protein [Streptomyces nitrosporeus]QEU72736.1 SGNH/GDSL hydrolase family protein [Streptomyces nitrosporeus]GGY75523.1 lipase [Streptomyces nitrosporeus]
MRHAVSRPRIRALAVGLTLAAATLLPAGSAGATDQYEWAALGDSFTAGVFVGDPQPPLGDPSQDGCARTSASYPSLVAQELAASPPGKSVQMTNVACSSAVIANVAKVKQTPISPVEIPADGWPAVDTQIKRAGLDSETDVVTVAIGGNSIPFGDIFPKCLEQGALDGSCRDYFTNPPAGVESIQQRLTRVRGEYIEMLAAVHKAAPNAKVLAVGYPTIMPTDATDCDRGSLTELGETTHADVDWLRDGVLKPLNKTIKQAASFFGDRYVDIASSSEGHDVCQPEGTKWIEGICGDAADYWPTTFPGTDVDCGPIGKHATMIHPNAAGHANTAVEVERAVRIALHHH